MLEYKILIKLLCVELRVHMLCKVTSPPLESCLDFPTTLVWNIYRSKRHWGRYDQNVHWSS